MPDQATPTDPWHDLVGQDEAIATLKSAAHQHPAHAWLIVGPPGSGRSNLAYAFAAELLNSKRDPADMKDAEAIEKNNTLVRGKSHPDLTVLSTERMIITIDEVRKLVASAHYAPVMSPYRVMVIEDADRMAERSSNVLLKALEEPPETTIWVLCAPSEADLLPTIRSRVRTLRLNVPDTESVATLIASRNTVDLERAHQAARMAQNHVGMASRLATSDAALQRRTESLDAVLRAKSAVQAVKAAQELLQIAEADAKDFAGEETEEEKRELYRMLGLEPGAPIPAAQRSQFREFDEQQKRKNQRGQRDAIDRILVDLLGLYRDALLLAQTPNPVLINTELRAELDDLVKTYSPQRILKMVAAVEEARQRLTTNAAPLLLLEAMMVGIVTGILSDHAKTRATVQSPYTPFPNERPLQ